MVARVEWAHYFRGRMLGIVVGVPLLLLVAYLRRPEDGGWAVLWIVLAVVVILAGVVATMVQGVEVTESELRVRRLFSTTVTPLTDIAGGVFASAVVDLSGRSNPTLRLWSPTKRVLGLSGELFAVSALSAVASAAAPGRVDTLSEPIATKELAARYPLATTLPERRPVFIALLLAVLIIAACAIIAWRLM